MGACKSIPSQIDPVEVSASRVPDDAMPGLDVPNDIASDGPPGSMPVITR
jgi:hypothetical protein